MELEQNTKQQNRKTIYLIRHGETVDNVSETLQGQRPGKLNENGIQQAILRGKQMENYKIERAWVSDLKRAHDTFLNIHQQMKHKIPKIELKEIVRERCFGEAQGWHNSKYREEEAKFKEINGEDAEYVAEGAESQQDLNQRVLLFIEELKDFIKDEKSEKSLVVVSHGIFLRRLLHFMKEQTIGSQLMHDHLKYSNVELTEFQASVDEGSGALQLHSWKKERLPGQPEVLDRAQM
ncbi:hypothetical protein PPERSA_13142 [Pseudocohnilembus persalinus]|uniref:Histidine phosphatase superfamily, clade-1 n=1 Tax=Pseudocohnilembus persalinus TaxID=266149 RepID=A0A0V0QBM6_PSEPJ|nr:hypothetical protein PPERSA_13142 [Pseudocohnilembus persalinus]|eukprot:KRW99562.1 hypothetical protein PPERSA_13142 [Pseudocohnilembus persalinus]